MAAGAVISAATGIAALVAVVFAVGGITIGLYDSWGEIMVCSYTYNTYLNSCLFHYNFYSKGARTNTLIFYF